MLGGAYVSYIIIYARGSIINVCFKIGLDKF